MPLRLIGGGGDEKDVVLGGTTFRVRKIPDGANAVLEKRNTVRGKVDEDGLRRDRVVAALVGWRDLYDRAGKPVPYSTESVPFPDPLTGEPVIDEETGEPRTAPLPYVVACSLPLSIVAVILNEAIGAEVHLVHEAVGNS